MALSADQITAITNALYLKMFPQLFADQNLVQKRLHAKGTKAQGGERIKQHVKYQGMGGGWFSEHDVFDTSGRENLTAAFFEWRQLYTPMVVTGLQKLRNSGPAAVRDLMTAVVDVAGTTGGEQMADAFFLEATSGSGTDDGPGPNSIYNIADNATGAFGGTTCGTIDKSTYSWWAGNVFDLNTDTGVANAGPRYIYIQQAWGVMHDGNIHPDLIVMHPSTFATFMADQQPQQQYMRQSELDAGFLTATFNGATVSADRHIVGNDATDANNRALMLNTKYLDIVTHVDENMRLEPFVKKQDQDVWVGYIMWAGNFTTSDPSRQMIIHDFDYKDSTT